MISLAGSRVSLLSVRVLLTNDDGIAAEGLQSLRRALLEQVPGIDLVVVAPDGNRSAMARSITTRRPLAVEEVPFEDGTVGYATDGTPVDCVRLAMLGIRADWQPDFVVSGINHGSNIGDDISYSGTVAAAIEGILLGLPAVAASQQSLGREMDFLPDATFSFEKSAPFVARLVADLESVPLPPATLLNVNFPGHPADGVLVAPLGRRVYRDELAEVEPREPVAGAGDARAATRRLYRIYGSAGHDPEEQGTDIAAVAAGQVAITPLHFDLTHHPSLDALAEHGLARLLG